MDVMIHPWRNFLASVRKTHPLCDTFSRKNVHPQSALTPLPLVPHICQLTGSALVQLRLVTWLIGAKPLNQCWFIVNWTIRNKVRWNSNKMQNFSFMKMHLKMSSVKWRQFCPRGDEYHEGWTLRCSHALVWYLLWTWLSHSKSTGTRSILYPQ